MLSLCDLFTQCDYMRQISRSLLAERVLAPLFSLCIANHDYLLKRYIILQSTTHISNTMDLVQSNSSLRPKISGLILKLPTFGVLSTVYNHAPYIFS